MGARISMGFLLIGYFLLCCAHNVENESSERTVTAKPLIFGYDSNETKEQSSTESSETTTKLFRPSKQLFENVYILPEPAKETSEEVFDKLDTSLDLNQTYYSPVHEDYLSSIMVLPPQMFDYKFNDQISLNSEEIKPPILNAHVEDQHMDESIVYGKPVPLDTHATIDLTSENLNSYEKKEKEVHYHQHKHFHDHEHNQKHSHKHEQDHTHNHSHGHKHDSRHDHGHQDHHEHQHTSNHQHAHEGNHQHEHRGVHHHAHKGSHKHDHDHDDNHWHNEKQHHNHQHKSTHSHHSYGNHGHDHKHGHAHHGKHEHHHQESKQHRHPHEHSRKRKQGHKGRPQQTIVIKKHHH